MIRIFSSGIAKIPHLKLFLAEPFTTNYTTNLTAVAGWGNKATAQRARNYARVHQIPYLALEDGFLRSVNLGDQDPPLSLIIDDLGMYYDVSAPSRLEFLITRELKNIELTRATELKLAWQQARVSKYNHSREFQGILPIPYVLVADQIQQDVSIQQGLATPASFSRMLTAALAENPHATILLKIHPDVFAGRKRGHFALDKLKAIPRVQVLTENVHPVRLIQFAQSIYTVTSQLGFEGLLWERPVRTFGMPFYAGWGLTQDDLPAPVRRQHKKILLNNLIHAALIEYPRYINPETEQRCEVEDLIKWMSLQRTMRERFAPIVYGFSFSPWKRPLVRNFLQGSQVKFLYKFQKAPAAQTLIIWGLNQIKQQDYSQQQKFLRLEDGFLRSVGLGTDLIRPISWVIDQTGIYYDARQPSDLENILEHYQFDFDLLARARALREKISAAGITKYNLRGQIWQRPAKIKHQKLILVPGQVETDASIISGAPDIKQNLNLLKAVRAANPQAYVIYKPHPDVTAGLRLPGYQEDQAIQWCDEIVNTPLEFLFPQIDEVHVMTSLAGFEALLREKPVVCYGLPFYAGWGLTTDLIPCPRRTRKLCLDSLIAGALLLYPTYLSRTTGRFTTPERALDELLTWRVQTPDQITLKQKFLRFFLRFKQR